MKPIQVKVPQKILKPPHEVFEAIVDPIQLSSHFTSAATARLTEGASIRWIWDDAHAELTVAVKQVRQDELIVFEWEATGVKTLVKIEIESLDLESSVVRVTESEWPPNDQGVERALGQTNGWTAMLHCLKAYLEYGINLRRGGVAPELVEAIAAGQR